LKKILVITFFLIPPLLAFSLYLFAKIIPSDQGIEYAKNIYNDKICFSFRYKECTKIISEKKKNVILLGNSQLTAINDLNKNDFSICARLIKKFEKSNTHNFKCYSLPNLNPEEINFIFKNYLNEFNHPTKIIIPLFYDDFARESGIRNSLNDNLSLSTSIKDHNSPNYKYLFNEIIKKNKAIIESNLILLRNFIFNINEFSIRKKIPNIYSNNIQYLQSTINFLSKNKNIEIITYYPPLRSDYPLPFEMKEYQFFKKEISSFLNNKNIKNYDFDNYIDSKYFGQDLNGRIDFIHFKNEGHKILSNEILKIINDF